MLLEGGHSGLVRLSDSLKTTLTLCAKASLELVSLITPHIASYRELRRLGAMAMAQPAPPAGAVAQAKAVASQIPLETAQRVAYVGAHEVHTLALSGVLLSCFCLESYINTLAYYIFREADLLSLLRQGHGTSAEVLMDAIARMQVRDKWATVGKLTHPQGFDSSRRPFQDFQILFRFRNDQVHDKVINWGSSTSKDPYNGKLPNDLTPLELKHALFAAETYWEMVEEVHRLTSVPAAEFHRHFNLRPWADNTHHDDLRAVSARVAALTLDS